MSEAPPTPTPSVCNYAALRRATRGIGQLYGQALAPCGLNAAQYSLLSAIARLKSPSQSQLAVDLVMDLSALGHTLKPLIRDGFVATLPDEADARKRRIALTPVGDAKLKEAAKLQKPAQGRFETVLGREKARALRLLLDYLASGSFSERFSK